MVFHYHTCMSINLNRLDLATLRLFVWVVDQGSLTAGAEMFGISLAAASKRISELESHVGTPLLLRSKKGVQPTAAGMTLKRHAMETVARLEQLCMTMNDFQKGTFGHLSIWANTSAFAHFLPSVLSEYLRRYPQVRVDLEDVLSEDAARAVAQGVTELAVIGENTPTEGLETMVCETDELVLITDSRHPLVGQGLVNFATILDYDLVGMNRSTSLIRQVQLMAAAIGKPLNMRVQVRSFDAMCKMVSAGVGVAILPRNSAMPHAPALNLVIQRINGMWTSRRLIVAMRSRQSLSRPAADFVALVEALRAGS
jgi:DNA-binding transcriptional LysR family regulator